MLQIKVFMTEECRKSGKKCAEFVKEIPLGLAIPVDSLVSDFRFLYGAKCVVEFVFLPSDI